MKHLPTFPVWLALAAGGCSPPAEPEPAPGPSEAPKPATPEPAECESCKKLAKRPAAVPDADGLTKTAWLEPAARGGTVLTGLRVADQDGHELDVSELGGRPVALTFLYTRCTNPNRCPLVATRMGQLQKLAEAEKLDGRVALAVVTYDPDHDTPDVLRRYGTDHGIRFTPGVRLLRPDREQKDDFFDRLRVTVNYNPEGVNLHGLQLFLFDRAGRFVRLYRSVVWDNADVLADLKRLADEPR